MCLPNARFQSQYTRKRQMRDQEGVMIWGLETDKLVKEGKGCEVSNIKLK